MARLRFDLDGIPLDDEEGRTTAILRFRTTAGLVLALPESVDVTVPWADLAEASVDLARGRITVRFADAARAPSLARRRARALGRVDRSPGPRGAAAVKRWAACAVLLWAARASAGAWTRDAGHGYVATGWARIAATSVFAGDGTTQPIPRYEQNAWLAYGELGLVSRWLTATVESTLVRDNAQAGEHTTGIGDWRFGAWTGVVERPVRLSFGATVTVPLGSPTPRDVQPGRLPLGSGEYSLDLRAAFGWSWPGGRRWPLRHYFTVEAGYWRRQIFADSFVYRVEVGVQLPWRVVDRVWLVGRLLGVESFASDARATADPTGLDDGFTVLAPGFAGVVLLWRGLAVDAGFETALRARAVAASKQVHAGVSWQW